MIGQEGMHRAKQASKNNQEHKTPDLPTPLARQHAVFLFVAIGLFCVLAIYVFLISTGTWTTWPAITTYYDQLAASFSRGKLSLDLVPDPALLALSNPYDPELRADVPFPRDMSLYKEKFYPYFGPVPALVLLFVKIFIRGTIGDQYLVFAFTAGILLVETLLLIRIWKGAFSDIPAWLILPCILVVGLVSPFGWMLSLTSIHHASILGGQFFFLAGLYTVSVALLDDSSISGRGLFITGILWICAIGSRITQLVPVGFMVILTLGWIINKHRGQSFLSRTFPLFVSIGLPMFIGVVCLGWYNWARFDSVFEIGTTYQLAGPNLQKHQNELFSAQYIPNNVYNYFLLKPDFIKKFPFLEPIHGRREPILKAIDMPDVYYSQETAGLLYIAPFILFAIPAFITALDFLRRGPAFFRESSPDIHFRWLTISLFGSFLSNLLFFLVFFWVGVRYQADFMPTLMLLSVIGFGQVYLHLASKPIARNVYTTLGFVLTATTIIASNLMVLSINSARYKELNPELWAQLTNFFKNLLQ